MFQKFNRDPINIPFGAESIEIKPKDLPERARETLQTLLATWIQEMRSVRESDGETLNMGDYVISISLWQFPGIVEERFSLGIHEKGCPFNPSGNEWFVKADGSPIGWIES